MAILDNEVIFAAVCVEIGDMAELPRHAAHGHRPPPE